MAGRPTVLIHATAVALPVDGGWAGILLRGPSGSGKSDLAVRLIDDGGRLIADDQTELWRAGGGVILRAPARLAGLLEVRGVGVVPVPAHAEAPLVLVAELTLAAHIERLPAPHSVVLAGVSVPALRLAPFEASAGAKLRLAAKAAAGGAFAALDRAALP